MSSEQPEDILRGIAQGWLKKIELSLKHKRPFTEDAAEAMSFFDGPHNWFWQEKYAKGDYGYNRTISPPGFRMQINRVFEAVKLFASVIYHRNPVRTITPTKFPFVPPEVVNVTPEDMESQQRYQMMAQATMAADAARHIVSELLSRVLNYTPNELDLKTHSRRVVDEAIIKGMGVWWTELVTDPGSGNSMIGSFADSVDNFTMDPDATEIEDISWCARRCSHPIDVVAKQYGLSREALKANLEGRTGRVSDPTDAYANMPYATRTNAKPVGKTNELVTYWKIWSKTGFGDRLKDAPKDSVGSFDSLGDNCYIVVAEGIDYPLNVTPEMMAEPPNEQTGVPDTLFTAVQWPIPFWAESNGWPFVPLAFHRKPGYIWPISHIKPGVPELRFLNWALSFLAQRVATSCETMIGVSKAADQDIKDQILAHSEGGFKIVELSETLGRSVSEIVSVFQLPPVNGEIFAIIDRVAEMFDKRVGLTELAYGMTRAQMRSATEAQVRAEQISVRPDDMAECLENAMSLLARREALAARWLLQPQDVEPIIGPVGAEAWAQHVAGLDPYRIAREYEYRVEAGSARKPNKATRQEQMQMALQTLGPVLQQLIPMGVVDPFNALISDWADSLDIDAEPYLVPPPPPPQPPPPGLPGPGGPPPEEGGPPPDMPPDGGPPPDPGMPPEIPPELSILPPEAA